MHRPGLPDKQRSVSVPQNVAPEWQAPIVERSRNSVVSCPLERFARSVAYQQATYADFCFTSSSH